MIGTLLEDLASGMSVADAKERFATKMDPLHYQRPQAAPTAGNIARAEKLFAELGLERALHRRFAQLHEVDALWRAHGVAAPAGLFGHLLNARPEPQPAGTEAITWRKFSRDVLPYVASMEALIPSVGNFCAIVTAQHDDAPPLLQWDDPQRRNPFSWYVYASGSPAFQWKLTPHSWTPVNAVCLQPSEWFGRAAGHHGESAIFILHGAQETRRAGSALFPEMLRSELREVRATIEAHSRSAVINGMEQASACGLRTVAGGGLQATLRTTSKSGVRASWRIDRWE
jgi:hypothetical protein